MGAELLLPATPGGRIGGEGRYDYQRRIQRNAQRIRKKPYVLHAEANAITKLARSSNNSDGSTIYITASPCIECAKLIIQAGIKRVVYGEQYRLTDGIDLLKRAGIETIYINPEEK